MFPGDFYVKWELAALTVSTTCKTPSSLGLYPHKFIASHPLPFYAQSATKKGLAVLEQFFSTKKELNPYAAGG